MTRPTFQSLLRKTFSRSSNKKKRLPSSPPPSSSTAPHRLHRSPSKWPTTASEDEGIEKSGEGQAAGGGHGRSGSASSKSMPADEKMADTTEGEGDHASSAKNKGIGKEESSEGESKSKGHDIVPAREGREEHRKDNGKLGMPSPDLPTPEASEAKVVEKMSTEQAERRNLKDDGHVRAGEKPVKIPERTEGGGDASRAKDEVESKSRGHEIIAASEGQEEPTKGEGKLEAPPPDLPTPDTLNKKEAEIRAVKDDAVSSTSSKPVPGGYIRAGDGDVRSVQKEAINPPSSSSSPTLVEGESKSKDHEIIAASEGQEEHRRGEGKLETPPPDLLIPETLEEEGEKMSKEHDERRNVKDNAVSSTSLKPEPAGEGDVSGGKKEAITPPSSSLSPALVEGESKSKDHEMIAATEGQEERRKGEGKLETPPLDLLIPETLEDKEAEKTSQEQAERRNVKDDGVSSTSLKPEPAGADIRAGEGDVSSVQKEAITPPSSSSSPALVPTDEASSEEGSKSKDHEIIAASEGQEEHRKAVGKLETPPPNLPTPETSEEEAEKMSKEHAARRHAKDDAASSTSSKPVPANEGDMRAGEVDVSSEKNEAIPHSSSSSSPTLLSTSEANLEGESKSRERQTTAESEEQVELRTGHSKPELPPSDLPVSDPSGKGEIETTPAGEGEISGVKKDSIFSVSSKQITENEGWIEAGKQFIKMLERKEEKKDASSGKNEGIMPSSPSTLSPTGEARAIEESKSKEHSSPVTKDDQDERKMDESKLDHLEQRDIERTSEEQPERKDVKDDASSLKPLMHEDKEIQAGETTAVLTPKRKEEEADTNRGSTADISPLSLELVKMSSEKKEGVTTSSSPASSIEESKKKEYGSSWDSAGDGGIIGAYQRQGDKGGEKSHVEETTVPSMSLPPISAAHEEFPTGDQKLSSTEAISTSSISPEEDEGKPAKSGDLTPKRKEGDAPAQLSVPTDEMSSMAEEQKEPEIGEPKPKIADGRGAGSNGSEGIVPSPSPLLLPTSKQSSTADSKIDESETKLKGETTGEETKLSQGIVEDKKRLEGEETSTPTPAPSGRRSTEEPETAAGREGQEEHSTLIQPSPSPALPMSRKPSNEELRQGMSDANKQIKKRGLKEEMKGSPKRVMIISEPSYKESGTNEGAIPSAPVPALPEETGSGDQLRGLKDDDEGGKGASEWKISGKELGVIAMVSAAILCMGSVVLLKRLENIRRRKR